MKGVNSLSEFEKQVRHALLDRDMTFKELAEYLEITVSYLHDIVTGKRLATNQKRRIKEFLCIEDDGGEEYE